MNIGGPLIAVGRVFRVSFTIIAAGVCLAAGAQVNSWINPASGNWDDSPSWSLGVLPNSSQSVMITNSGFKAVAINPSTPVNFPGSMTVSSLTIQGATNSDNLLLLNFFGTAVPLTVLNGLTLQDNAQIENLNSGLLVEGGTVTVTNSQINQDGGSINTMGAQMNLSDSMYNLTNGDFEGGSVSIGYPASAQFNQYGGTAIITNLSLASSIVSPIQNGISLYGGILNLPSGMNLTGDGGGAGYFQSGGTNLTTRVTIVPNYGGFVSGFTLNGGLLADSGVQLMAGYKTPISIYQNGGSHVITNALSIYGSSPDGTSVDPATYNLAGGTLSAGTIELDADQGDSFFVQQSNSTATAGTVYTHSVGYYSGLNTHLTLEGGTLSCLNYTNLDGGGTLNQSGGALVVSNLLNFGGSRSFGITIYGTYTFTGGTVTASNINIGGTWIIGDGTTNRISDPGTFSLSHLLVISNATEELGQFILAGTNATINLAGSASQLSFANSSALTWAGGATLVISNWNGNTSGGGAEYLKFGTDQSGLTATQLSQIQFQIGTNSYPAKILSTGEVVPNQGSSGGGLVNSWTNPASANWDQATNWSLGILPDSSQSVMITNSGFKAVAIQPSTPINFPGSMTVSNLTITSPTNGGNLLLMNYVGAGSPLVIGSTNTPGSLVIGPNAFIEMHASGLLVNNALGANNSRLGGFEVGGTFIQSDSSEVIAEGFLDVTGTYNLTNGQLWGGGEFINGTFNQQGGTNTGDIILNAGHYDLNEGTVISGVLALTNGASFGEFGGFVTNGGMMLTGTTNSIGNPVTSVYTLQFGAVETPYINLNGSSFNHLTGTNIVGAISISNSPGAYVINSGLLSVDQINVANGGLFQDNGGTLNGSNNVTLANGIWSEGHASLQLGQLTLSGNSNSVLNLLGTPTVLRFAGSSSAPWASGARLTIMDWTGSTNGGGEDQLYFGTSASGLTAQQLSQVQFNNPAGLPGGTYSARILSSGEVVPSQIIAGSVAFSTQGNNLVLTWPSGWVLQSSTNIIGPYTDVPGAASPYTNDMTLEPLQFFRLRQ